MKNKNLKLNRLNQKQHGFGLVGLFGSAFLVMFFAVMIISLAPSYIENFSVRSCLTSVSEDLTILSKNKKSIKQALLKKLSVSNVKSVTQDNIQIEKDRNGVKIRIDYEVHAKFISNVDFVVRFDESKEVTL